MDQSRLMMYRIQLCQRRNATKALTPNLHRQIFKRDACFSRRHKYQRLAGDVPQSTLPQRLAL